MARSGDIDLEFNEDFFATVLRSPGVEALVDGVGARTEQIAKSTAPVDSGDYRDGIGIRHRESKFRRVTEVVGTDDKTLLIEAKTGNLARALKAAKQP
ncbi:HK97 gp10 family phage protein [Microbacterium sp. PAMC21962]|uniref:HK97 gp10 family phage protein n=1 Tax=Microbacterium sp. PAMC21962 TaxID=2861280 RepID=UPI001C629530|nr:HK97 gp10 family phage protein [Microbacterium sp. PAMC21962]QYF98910.1 HK97 gp10 family phage protein [Microbacterium sp. PAMC21962]